MESTRRPDIDALRVLATYLLFVFHVGKVFDPAPFFHVRNDEQSFAFLVVCGFIGLWHMPLFFLLAGWSAVSALGRRPARGFVVERVRRLFVPLLAGCVLLAPVIKYFELRSGLDLNHRGLWVGAQHQDGIRLLLPGGLPLAPPFDEPFATFLPTFFTSLDRFTWSHLWFIAYLFTMSLAYLPLLLWIAGQRLVRAPGAVVAYAPLVPLVVIQLTLRQGSPGIYNLYDDWANVAYYSVFQLSGALLARHAEVERVVDAEWRRSAAIGTGATVVLLLGVLGVLPSPTVLLVATAVAAWCFVVALLGLGRLVVHTPSPALGYLSESAFPVYVLHQAAIVVPGYFLVGTALGIGTKFVLLLLLATAITMATYHWLVRPFAVPRVLLGMKPRRAYPAPSVAARRSAAALLLVALCLAPRARAATPEGEWHAEGGAARVAIARCGDALCGRVVWLRSPFDDDGCDLLDRQNPDPALRDRPILGLEVLRAAPAEGSGRRADGTIYDPTSGRTYSCDLTLETRDRLRVRGYLGIRLLGRTATWTRVGSEPRQCAERRASDATP